MKKSFFLLVASLACAALAAATPPDVARILATSSLRFEPGPGIDSNEFIARGLRSRLAFNGAAASIRAGGNTLRFEFAGADRRVRLEGLEKMRSTTGIFIGNDRSKWRPAVANYARLQARELYRGIDLVYYGSAGELEYDLLVKPGADPRRIRVTFPGSHPSVDRDGNLDVSGGALILKRPVAFQIAAGGEKIAVDSRFRRNTDGSYGFALGHYDHERELVIDPVLTLSQYIGGSSQDIGYAIGHDASGFLYIAGTTYSSDFPTAGPAAGNTPPGGEDLFIAKIDPRTSQIIYAGFIGGSGNDSFGGMVVDASGYVYLTGTTQSSDFPTANAADTTLNGTSDAFVMKLDLFEVPLYSTYLGGSGVESANAIALDSRGRMWVTGGTQSTDFPIANGFQTASAGSQDVFVAGIDPTQSGSGSLFYSTYLGGSWWDTGRGIAVAPDQTVWVVGGTYSYNFPIAGPSLRPNYGSGGDAFVAQINPAANSLTYSTFLGGTDLEEARSVVIDANGRAIVSGYTSSQDFPVTGDALQGQYGGNTDVFLSILNPPNSSAAPGQLVYSTYFGGSNPDVPFDLKMDASGNLYLAGFTMSSGLAASANALQAAYDNTLDAFALKLNPSKPGTAAISYFTYLGSDGFQIAYGIDFDANNNIYLTGYTSGPIFDALGGAGKGTSAGNPDTFVIGFSAQ